MTASVLPYAPGVQTGARTGETPRSFAVVHLARRMSRRAAAGVAILAMLAVSACTATAPAPIDARTAPSTVTPNAPDTSRVAIGDGREIFLECRGSGEPTVILESGIHDASDYWTLSEVLPPAVETPVMDALAQTNRVCRYDRPGTVLPVDPQVITDRSTPVTMPRTIGDAVADLHRLLEVAEVPGPYVLVAHSWGGMIAQLFARTYPDKVGGLVLVDAFAPSTRELLGVKWDAYVEVLNDPPGAEPLSEDPDYEKYDVDASIDEIAAAPPLPDIPLVVLTKTAPFPEFPDGAGMTNDDIDGVWPAAQLSLVDLLPNTPQIIAHGSIHYIQITEPDVVVSAARLVMARMAGTD
jgi:pimeloyl-ACP methyl ester carboxylesterase